MHPQLVMRRPHLDGLPPVNLPDGYHIRSFRAGDEGAWDAIVLETFETEPGQVTCEKNMRTDPAFRPERVLFVVHGGEAVGTASAWHREHDGRDTGYLHMVGVYRAHQNRRLGYWISLAALHHLRREGCADVLLQTDDFRLPAIKTYLNLDFEPVLVHQNQPQRWREVFAQLGDGEALCRRFAPVLDGEAG